MYALLTLEHLVVWSGSCRFTCLRLANSPAFAGTIPHAMLFGVLVPLEAA